MSETPPPNDDMAANELLAADSELEGSNPLIARLTAAVVAYAAYRGAIKVYEIIQRRREDNGGTRFPDETDS